LRETTSNRRTIDRGRISLVYLRAIRDGYLWL